jgi:cobalt-zinc-cadmium efflux system protein
MSVHVVVEDEVLRASGVGVVLDQLGECLQDHFDIGHSTFQVEPASHAAHEPVLHA